MGRGEPLAQEDVDKLGDISHVVSVHESVQTQHTAQSHKSAAWELISCIYERFKLDTTFLVAGAKSNECSVTQCAY